MMKVEARKFESDNNYTTIFNYNAIETNDLLKISLNQVVNEK